MPQRLYTDAEIDAAIGVITDPGRLREAQDLIARCAPSLPRVLNAALSDGGWFDQAHEQALREAASGEDPEARSLAVRALVAEQTRLGMLVGVAVGFALARELAALTTQEE